MTRTFIAIELGETARVYLIREITRLARELPTLHWADPAGMHLTLAFLGELDSARLAEAQAAAEEAAPVVMPFALHIAGLGSFGPLAAPRVIWAGVAGDLPALARLHAALAAALERRGFALDTRPFAPHLTLARVRAPLPPAAVARLGELVRASQHATGRRAQGAGIPAIPVDRLSVMKSELVRPTARYTCLVAVPLGRSAP